MLPTLRAMREIEGDPQLGLDATFALVPDLATDPATQRAILDATIAGWSNAFTDTAGLGAIDPDAWAASIDFLTSMEGSPVAGPVTVDEVITRDLLPAAP